MVARDESGGRASRQGHVSRVPDVAAIIRRFPRKVPESRRLLLLQEARALQPLLFPRFHLFPAQLVPGVGGHAFAYGSALLANENFLAGSASAGNSQVKVPCYL